MRMNDTTIQGLHHQLDRKIEECMGYPVRIGLRDGSPEWWRRSRRSKVEFEIHAVEAGREDIAKPMSTQFPVLSLDLEAGFDHRAWVSWWEEWESLGNRSFKLRRASLAFFWGPYNRDKARLFRAEWDDADCGAADAPQPHWHFDRRQLEITALGVEAPITPLAPPERRQEHPHVGGRFQPLVELAFEDTANLALQELTEPPVSDIQETPLETLTVSIPEGMADGRRLRDRPVGSASGDDGPVGAE